MAANNLKNEENNLEDLNIDNLESGNEPFSQKSKASGGLKGFCIQYKKFIAAGAMVALLGVVIACTSNGSSQSDKDNVDPGVQTSAEDGKNSQDSASILDEDFEVDAYTEVNELIQKYYECRAAGDAEGIEKIAFPITETEKSYIELYSKYVEKYENIKCYTKKGVSEGEYMVSVAVDTKFKDIKTDSPGLDFFYVRRNENGAYIDNAYGSFNEVYKETDTELKINELITQFNQDEDAIALRKEAQDKYAKALEDDKDLNKMVTQTVQAAISDWVASVGISSDQKEKEDDKKDTKTDDSKEGQGTSAEERTAYTTTKVNLREKRSINSEVVQTIKKNRVITVFGESKNGWLKVKYQDNTGYIKEDYITYDKPKDTSDKKDKDTDKDTSKDTDKKDTDQGNEETRTGYAKTGVNLRKSASKSSKIVKTLDAGTKVTIYGKSSGKWYQVKAKGKTGYIRKDFVVFSKSDVEEIEEPEDNHAPARYYNEGDQITLSESVNVRASMSESADRVGLAYKGEVLTVIMSYAEGWTKVSWNGQTGYVKTEFLD